MTATAIANNSALTPKGETGMPATLSYPLAAAAQAGKHQFVILSPVTGYGVLADDATPHQFCGGYVFPDELSSVDAVAGRAVVRTSIRWAVHATPSTISQDGFSAADVCTPFFLADGNTPGKLSNSGGKDRTLGGLVLGLETVGETPVRLWTGPVAQAVARSVLMANGIVGASHQIADAAANTATTEVPMTREAFHGLATGVSYTGDAVAADDTDYVTITIAKRNGAGGAATTMATYDSRAANQGAATALVPKAFALSAVAGALHLLETDIVTITVVKGGSGKALRGSIKLTQKVI